MINPQKPNNYLTELEAREVLQAYIDNADQEEVTTYEEYERLFGSSQTSIALAAGSLVILHGQPQRHNNSRLFIAAKHDGWKFSAFGSRENSPTMGQGVILERQRRKAHIGPQQKDSVTFTSNEPGNASVARRRGSEIEVYGMYTARPDFGDNFLSGLGSVIEYESDPSELDYSAIGELVAVVGSASQRTPEAVATFTETSRLLLGQLLDVTANRT